MLRASARRDLQASLGIDQVKPEPEGQISQNLTYTPTCTYQEKPLEERMSKF